MSYPIPNYTRIWVRGRMIDMARAATGENKYGAVTPLTFVPAPKVLVNPELQQIIAAGPFRVTPDEATGYWQIPLPATDDPDVNPINWTYRVNEGSTGRIYDIVVPQATPVLDSPGDPLHGQQVLELSTIVPAPGPAGGTVQLMQGRGISSLDIVDDQFVVTYTDNTTHVVGAVPAGGASGGAGGVLSGTYPNPGFAADMATQAELDALAQTVDGLPFPEGSVDTTGAETGGVYALRKGDGTYELVDGYTETLTRPPGLGWPAAPIPDVTATVTQPGASVPPWFSCPLVPETVFDAFSVARTAPTTTYYVATTGNDTNDGLTSGTAVLSISKAVQLGNATGAPYTVIVAAGAYARAQNMIYLAAPTQDVAFVASGGRVETGTFDHYAAPSVDATQANCYSWTLTNVARVLDLLRRNAFGLPAEMRYVSTAARCNAIPDSWTMESGKIYVNRGDGAAVTFNNTRVLRSTQANYSQAEHRSVYLGGAEPGSGFDLWGGDSGAFNVQPGQSSTTPKAVVAADCSFNYAGANGAAYSAANGVSINNFAGITYLARCRADGNCNDGFNFHNSASSDPVTVLTEGCSAYDNGRPGSTSCNGWTSHEDVIGVDIGGDYRNNRGGSVASVNSSKSWLVGTRIANDLGDIALGGTIPPTGVYVRDTAEYWCERVDVDMPSGPGRAYDAQTATAKIHRRRCRPVPQLDVGPGVFDTY